MQDNTLYQSEAQEVSQNMTPPPYQPEAQNDGTWKYVAIGGAAAVLVGAGAIVGTKALAAKLKDTEEAGDAAQDEAQDSSTPEAHVGNDLSFGEAFAEARAQVGPGGVFTWHGGVYGTYYETEWNAMTPAEKEAFSRGVHTEVSAADVDARHITAAEPDVHIHVHETHIHQDAPHATAQEAHTHQAAPKAANVHETAQSTGHHSILEEDDDVRLLATEEYEGHGAYLYSLDGNEDPDVAVIDVDDNGELTDPDVLVFKSGTVVTVEEIAQTAMDGTTVEPVETNPATDPALHTVENTDIEYDNPDYAADAPADVMG